MLIQSVRFRYSVIGTRDAIYAAAESIGVGRGRFVVAITKDDLYVIGIATDRHPELELYESTIRAGNVREAEISSYGYGAFELRPSGTHPLLISASTNKPFPRPAEKAITDFLRDELGILASV